MIPIRQTVTRSLSTSVRKLNTVNPRPLLKEQRKNIVLVDGVRTPFLTSWTDFKNLGAHLLQRIALNELMQRVGMEKSEVDYVCVGTTYQDPHTTNVAKEATVGASFSDKTTTHSLSMACISSFQSVATIVSMIRSGQLDCGIGGGVEFISDPNVRYSRDLRIILVKAFLAKTLSQRMQALKGIRPSHLLPDIPSPNEYSTGESMGEFADRLASTFKISREEQDSFAARSHKNALDSYNAGKMSDLIDVKVPQVDKFVVKDNGVRNSSVEKLATLKPAFIKPHGTVTAGNSSFYTDGASACLICTEEKALSLGLKPKAYIKEYTFTSASCKDQLLLGPVHAIPQTMKKCGLKLQDIGVWEIHEAFASQILANMKALNSDYFMKNYTSTKEKLGEIPIDKLNLWGGSLSIGHPFGATGCRLIMHAVNRMISENQELACVSGCAAGGQGAAMILERHPCAT